MDVADVNSNGGVLVDVQNNRFSKRTLTVATGSTLDSEKIDEQRFRLRKMETEHEEINRSRNVTRTCGQEARHALLDRACAWMRDTNNMWTDRKRLLQDFTYKMLFVDDKRKVIYCEVPKVACTSWKVLFANLSGNVSEDEWPRIHNLVHATSYYPKYGFKHLWQYSPAEREERLKNYYKFMVVRNPYSRIVSAWENKFKAHTGQSKWYHENVGRYIIKKYRENPSNASLATGSDVRFEELVKFVGNPDETKQSRFDLHFWHQMSICSPCLIKYDYIAKLETLQEDIDTIMEHITPGVKTQLPFLNANKRGDASASEIEKINSYFRNVTDIDLARLKQIYGLDTNAFGYSMVDNSYECDLNYHLN